MGDCPTSPPTIRTHLGRPDYSSLFCLLTIKKTFYPRMFKSPHYTFTLLLHYLSCLCPHCSWENYCPPRSSLRLWFTLRARRWRFNGCTVNDQRNSNSPATFYNSGSFSAFWVHKLFSMTALLHWAIFFHITGFDIKKCCYQPPFTHADIKNIYTEETRSFQMCSSLVNPRTSWYNQINMKLFSTEY